MRPTSYRIGRMPGCRWLGKREGRRDGRRGRGRREGKVMHVPT
jgi:hypothetical protein